MTAKKKNWDSGYHTICWEGESRSKQEESRKKEEKKETWEKWWDKKIGNEKERGHKDMRQERKTERWKEDRWKENKKTAERRSTGNETRANDWKQEETGKERKKDGEDEGRSAEEAPSVTTDGLSSAPYIRLPSDQKLPLTLTFGLPPHTRAHTDFSIMSDVSKDLVVKTLPHIVLYLKINTQKYVHLFIFL